MFLKFPNFHFIIWLIFLLSTSESPQIKINLTLFYKGNLAMFGHLKCDVAIKWTRCFLIWKKFGLNRLSANPTKCSKTLKQFELEWIVWVSLAILTGWRLKGESFNTSASAPETGQNPSFSLYTRYFMVIYVFVRKISQWVTSGNKTCFLLHDLNKERPGWNFC